MISPFLLALMHLLGAPEPALAAALLLGDYFTLLLIAGAMVYAWRVAHDRPIPIFDADQGAP